jgi:hypothetical protein
MLATALLPAHLHAFTLDERDRVGNKPVDVCWYDWPLLASALLVSLPR